MSLPGLAVHSKADETFIVNAFSCPLQLFHLIARLFERCYAVKWALARSYLHYLVFPNLCNNKKDQHEVVFHYLHITSRVKHNQQKYETSVCLAVVIGNLLLSMQCMSGV